MAALASFVGLLAEHAQVDPAPADLALTREGAAAPVQHITATLARINDVLARQAELRRLPRASVVRLWTLYESQLSACEAAMRDTALWERTAPEQLGLVRRLFEWMRNACAGVAENQTFACEMRVHVVANTLLLELLERRNHACEDAERTETTRAINMGMQALANMCTANPAVQTLVWPFFAAESQLLSTFLLLAEPAAAKYALVWIHNCTVDSPANCVALVDSTPGADAVASMLKMFSDEADDNDANFNLCFACIKTLLLADLAPRIWTQLDKIEDTDMSNAHVALLKALDGLASPASGARLEARLPLTGRLLAGVLVRTVARMAALMASPDPQLDATTEHFVTFAVLILQFLCAASLVCEPGDKEAWLDAGVVKALLDLLAGVSKLQPAMFGKTRAQPEQVQGNTFFMLKVDIIKVLANLAFESRRVQDLVRRLDGLPLVLSQCVIDDLNPYLREHALFAVRNLVMGNAENQALVASLEAREVVPNAMLDEMGVHAQVDPRTGKLRFVQPGHAAAAAAAPRGGPAADEGDADGGAASDGGGGGK